MKNSINVYWSIIDHSHPSLDLLSSKPTSLISDFIKKNKNLEYIKCPAFSREFNNTFLCKSFYDIIIDIDPKTLESTTKTTYTLNLKPRNKEFKHFSLDPHIVLFSDESLEISQIPSSLHLNNFTENVNVLSGKYNIGKWFRPLSLEFFLKIPYIELKKDEVLFYLKFHTDKKINFVNFKFNNEITKITNACLTLKWVQPGYNLKNLYNLFLKKKYNKRILKEIKANLTGY